jgi:hypothetical protein
VCKLDLVEQGYDLLNCDADSVTLQTMEQALWFLTEAKVRDLTYDYCIAVAKLCWLISRELKKDPSKKNEQRRKELEEQVEKLAADMEKFNL